jgi:putative tryptophan/tyrosine transport system substrate-binding protein
MRRREFIRLAGAAAAWPFEAHAQQQVERIRRVGVLLTLTKDNPDGQARVVAFRQGLEALGWKDGHNIRIEYRWPGDDRRALQVQAAELVKLTPDAIMVGGSRALIALQQQTQTIPIVFVAAAGTVEHGIVTSAARPRGNLTGFTTYDEFALAGKLLGTLKEMFPRLARALIIMHHDHPSIGGYRRQLEWDGPTLGVKPTMALAVNAAEIKRTIETFAGDPNGGLVLPPDQFNILHRDLIIALAAKHHLPAIYGYRSHVSAGGLLSYGTDIAELNGRAAGYVDRILKGEKPADLPVQAPTKYELAINLKTAKALGLDVPPTLIARADEVIE